MTRKLMCTCNKEVKCLPVEQIDKATKGLLKLQAEQIFEEIEEKTLHSVEEMERAMGDCETDIAYHNGMLRIRMDIEEIKTKLVGK